MRLRAFVVLLLLVQHGLNRLRGLEVTASQGLELLLQVAKHDFLDGHGGGRNRAAAEQACYDAQGKSPETAQDVAAAATHSPAIQLGPENLAVNFLVRAKLLEFRNQRRSGKAGQEDLARVDMHRAVSPA